MGNICSSLETTACQPGLEFKTRWVRGRPAGVPDEVSPAGFRSKLLRAFGRLDEFPKLRVFLQGRVFAGLDARAEEEILERVPVHDAMDQHAQLMTLKIHPVIPQAEAVEQVAVALQLAEIFQISAEHVLRQAAKVPENLQLQILGHPREFGGTGGRENNLKRIHE